MFPEKFQAIVTNLCQNLPTLVTYESMHNPHAVQELQNADFPKSRWCSNTRTARFTQSYGAENLIRQRKKQTVWSKLFVLKKIQSKYFFQRSFVKGASPKWQICLKYQEIRYPAGNALFRILALLLRCPESTVVFGSFTGPTPTYHSHSCFEKSMKQ